MSENLHYLADASKKEKYEMILPQVNALLSSEKNCIANCANLCAVLKEVFTFWWVGFYFIEEKELVLGPFQGPLACSRITYGKGVCGAAWAQEKTIIVQNVHEFEGHIACSDKTNSEIVVPFYHHEKLIGVLDIDSEHLAHFDAIDEKYLQILLSYIP